MNSSGEKSLVEPKASNILEASQIQQPGLQRIIPSPSQGSEPVFYHGLPQRPDGPLPSLIQHPHSDPQNETQHNNPVNVFVHAQPAGLVRLGEATYPNGRCASQNSRHIPQAATQPYVYNGRVPRPVLPAQSPAYHQHHGLPAAQGPPYNRRPQIAIYPGDLMYLPDVHEILTPAIAACRNAADLIAYGNNLITQGLASISRGSMMISQHMQYMNLVVHTIQELEELIEHGQRLIIRGSWYIQQARILDDQVVGNVSHAFRLGAATYPEDYLGPAREAIPSAAVVQQASVASAPERLRNVPRYAMHPNGENL